MNRLTLNPLLIRNTDNVRREKPIQLGDPAKHDMMHNCMTCMKWSVCKDNHKSAHYRCTKYREATIEATSIETIMSEGDDWSSNKTTTEEDFQKLFDEANAEQSITDMIEKVLSTNIPIPPDLRINDKDIPVAKNLLEWTTDRKFSGGMQTPFPRQIEIGTKVYGEFCPRCSDMEWWEDMPVDAPLPEIQDRVVFLEDGRCPTCKVRRNTLIARGEMHDYFSLILLAGQRSAKTSSAILWESYNTHRTLKLPNPSGVYGLLPSQPIYSTYTALTFGQAVENVWVFFKNILKDYPWYKQYHEFLDIKGQELGEELYHISEVFARYRHRNLFLSPSSPSKRVMRGRCITGSSIVNTNAGFLQMKELVRKDGYKKVKKKLSIDGPNGPQSVSHTYSDLDRTIKITTHNGLKIEGTYEHPMLVLTSDLEYKWMRLDELKIGHYIVSKTRFNQPQFGNYSITKEMAGLLGYLTANGRGTSFSSDQSQVVATFSKYAKTEGYLASPWTKHAGKVAVYNLKRDTHPIPFKQRLIEYGYTYKNSRTKQIPISIRTASKEIIHEYLEAYFECDSGINGGGDNKLGSQRPNTINVSSASKKFIDQMQVLLLMIYGIASKRSVKTTYDQLNKETGEFNQERNHYILSIRDKDAQLFLYTFRRAKVQRYANRLHENLNPSKYSVRVVPYVLDYLSNIWKQHQPVSEKGNRSKYIVLADGSKIKNNIRPPRTFSKTGCEHLPKAAFDKVDWQAIVDRLKLMNKNAAEKLEEVLDYDAHYEQITSIKFTKSKKRVYDVTVPSDHAFTANGLQSHNTRLGALVDELGWFPLARKGDSKKGSAADFERLDARGVRDALFNSMFTIRNAYMRRLEEGFHVPKPVFMTASSPQAYNDAIMTIYREAKNSRFDLALKYPTWEYNPTVSEESLEPEFERDPVAAARDFACEPPIGEGLFLNDTEATAKCFDRHRINAIQVSTFVGLSKTKKKITTSTLKIVSNVEPDFPCVVAVDVGLVNNSLAFSIISLPNDYDESDEPEDRGTHLNPVQVFACGEIIPRDGTRISLTHWYMNCLVPLCAHFNVAYFISDRWQNAKIASDLENEMDVNPIEWKCTWEDFENTRELIYTGNIKLPKLDTKHSELLETTLDNYPDTFRRSPIDHLYFQMATVKESTNVTVLKGDGVTDDLFRTIVLGSALMQDEEVFEYISTHRNGYSTTESRGPIGMVVKAGQGMKAGGNTLSTNGRGIGAVVRRR